MRLPNLLNLSSERIVTDGIFLMENSVEMIMWIGRGVHSSTIQTLFGLTTLDNVDMATVALQPDNSDFSHRVYSVIVALRQERSRHMQLHFIREGGGYVEAYFARFLVEDRYAHVFESFNYCLILRSSQSELSRRTHVVLRVLQLDYALGVDTVLDRIGSEWYN